jgi:hypothetical protein
MTGRMDWRRCRPYRAGSESKFGSDFLLPNGERTPVISKDNLALRAERALRGWARTLPARQRFEIEALVSIGGR